LEKRDECHAERTTEQSSCTVFASHQPGIGGLDADWSASRNERLDGRGGNLRTETPITSPTKDDAGGEEGNPAKGIAVIIGILGGLIIGFLVGWPLYRSVKAWLISGFFGAFLASPANETWWWLGDQTWSFDYPMIILIVFSPGIVATAWILAWGFAGAVVGAKTDAPIPWPVGKCGPGRHSRVVYKDLAKALRRESNQAISHWWGVDNQTVTKWRRASGVEDAMATSVGAAIWQWAQNYSLFTPF
jgi:hypothetical protein